MAAVIQVLIPVNVHTRVAKAIRGGPWILVAQLESTEWISPTEEMEQVWDCVMFDFEIVTDKFVIITFL